MRDFDIIGATFWLFATVSSFFTNPLVFLTGVALVLVHDVRGHNRMWRAKHKVKAKKRKRKVYFTWRI